MPEHIVGIANLGLRVPAGVEIAFYDVLAADLDLVLDNLHARTCNRSARQQPFPIQHCSKIIRRNFTRRDFGDRFGLGRSVNGDQVEIGPGLPHLPDGVGENGSTTGKYRAGALWHTMIREAHDKFRVEQQPRDVMPLDQTRNALAACLVQLPRGPVGQD